MPKKQVNEKFTAKHFIEAIKETGGIKTEICRRAGCSRPTFDQYLKKHPEIAEAFEEENKVVLDMARGALYECIEMRQPWAIMFFLERRDPNYARGQRTQESQLDPVKVEIVRRQKNN